jgi:plastocyanin
MRKRVWSAAASVLLLAGATVFLTGRTVQAADTVTMGSNADPYAFEFFPAEITVQVGSTVVWQNLSDLQHDAKADNGAFASKLLNKGETFEFKFTAPGDYSYFCTPHKDAGMKGIVRVGGGSPATPTTVATTPGTQPPGSGGATTTTTAKAGAAAASTSTTAKNAAAGNSTTTTTAGTGVTATTQAPSVTPTSGPDPAAETANAAPADQPSGEESAAADHGGEGQEKKEKSSPIGIAFASLSTLLLVAIAGKLLASKS